MDDRDGERERERERENERARKLRLVCATWWWWQWSIHLHRYRHTIPTFTRSHTPRGCMWMHIRGAFQVQINSYSSNWKAWLSQLVNFKNAIWTWGHFRRTICNKILVLEHLAWIEHQFLSGIRDSTLWSFGNCVHCTFVFIFLCSLLRGFVQSYTISSISI